MRLSKKGKSVHFEVGIWCDKKDIIHVTCNEIDDFHIAVNPEPERPNGHPTLYRRLAKCLKEAGAPAPSIEDDDDWLK